MRRRIFLSAVLFLLCVVMAISVSFAVVAAIQDSDSDVILTASVESQSLMFGGLGLSAKKSKPKMTCSLKAS